MMRPAALLPATLLLAACLLAGCSNPFRGGPDMPDAQCRSVAQNDPIVRRETARYASGVGNAFRSDREVVDEALLAAYNRCVRARSPNPTRGGVEPVRR